MHIALRLVHAGCVAACNDNATNTVISIVGLEAISIADPFSEVRTLDRHLFAFVHELLKHRQIPVIR